ncbi:MAG: DUF5686 family protein [Flavobacteriaceae bacterium]|jgi:hypothetical protein|nr:DUF5686 family protein [Flavobacteriaceae bacterium]
MKEILIFFSLSLPLLSLAQNSRKMLPYEKKNTNHPVFELLKKIKSHEKKNHPDNLKAYSYYVYNKFYIDEYKYNYSPDIDSLTIPDLNNQELLLLGERITECKYDQKYGRKNKILADRISGFKEPYYELFNEQVLKEEFPKVLKKYHLYNFRLIDSIDFNQKKTYVLAFASQKGLLINGSRGSLYIDAESYAVVKYSGEEYGNSYTRYFEYNWKPFQGIWYPEKNIQKIRFGAIDLFKLIYRKYRKEKLIFVPWVVIESHISRFSPSEGFPRDDFKGYMYELEEEHSINPDSKISPFRQNPLNSREKKTYASTSSLFDLFPVERNIKTLRTIKKGKFPIKQVNLDLLSLLSFNDYEGFRIQLGGKTNPKFSQDYSLHGYAAYGSKDTNFKGAAGMDLFINKKYDGILSINAYSDVNPSSREIYRTPESMEQIRERLNYVQNSFFYSYRKGKISYTQDFFKRFTTSFIVDYQAQRANYEYSYKNKDPQHWFNQFTTSLRIKYAPFAKYMQTPEGKLTIENKPVYFYFDYTRGWKGLDADFDYHKFGFSSDISVKNFFGTSNFMINSGYIFGETTLWNLYGSFGNAKSGSSVFKRFSAKGFHSFETLSPGDFFADKYVALHFTHTFNDLPLWNAKKIQIALIYNGMIGNMEHTNLHSILDFQTPDKYYQEAGIELNKLVSYLGLGLYYRMGAYHQQYFDDNLFLKVTFNLF